MKMITIFTPTFNRSDCLKKVYTSLLEQTSKNFVWLIIDDGSTDNTRRLVNEWIKEQKITIFYKYQCNQGKWKATNTAIQMCNTKYFAFLDSDDYYIPETIKFMEDNLTSKEIDGIIGTRGENDHKIMGEYVMNNVNIVDTFDHVSKKLKYFGETCRVYKIEVLLKNMYPEIDSKFIPENVMLGPIDANNKILFTSKILSISKYREDGITKNITSFYKNNKDAILLSYRQSLKNNKGVQSKLKICIAYILFCKHEKIHWYYSACPHKILLIILYPFSYLYDLVRKEKND